MWAKNSADITGRNFGWLYDFLRKLLCNFVKRRKINTFADRNKSLYLLDESYIYIYSKFLTDFKVGKHENIIPHIAHWFRSHIEIKNERVDRELKIMKDKYLKLSNMIPKEYKIMHIGDGTDNKYGEIIIVKANVVTNTDKGKSFTPYIYDNTTSFFFPNRKDFLNQLVQIANGGGFWSPNLMGDFQPEFIRDESTGNLIRIFRHRSFYGGSVRYNPNLNNNTPIQLIAQKESKIKTLYEQYVRKGWSSLYTFDGYIESLAEDDNNTKFWKYLFGTSDFDGCIPIDLPSEHYASYTGFLDSCKNIDLPF